MALDRENAFLDPVGHYIHKQFKEQSWFQENANTLTTGVGFLVTVATWAATQPFAVDPRVQVAILLIGFLGTVFGVKKTPNGFSKSQVQKIDAARAEFIGSTPLRVEEYEEEGEQQPIPDLDALISEYISES